MGIPPLHLPHPPPTPHTPHTHPNPPLESSNAQIQTSLKFTTPSSIDRRVVKRLLLYDTGVGTGPAIAAPIFPPKIMNFGLHPFVLLSYASQTGILSAGTFDRFACPSSPSISAAKCFASLNSTYHGMYLCQYDKFVHNQSRRQFFGMLRKHLS